MRFPTQFLTKSCRFDYSQLAATYLVPEQYFKTKSVQLQLPDGASPGQPELFLQFTDNKVIFGRGQRLPLPHRYPCTSSVRSTFQRELQFRVGYRYTERTEKSSANFSKCFVLAIHVSHNCQLQCPYKIYLLHKTRTSFPILLLATCL